MSQSIDQVDALLPQTQCGLCGYPACRPYAQAIVEQNETIDKCSPGGLKTLWALAELVGQDPAPFKEKVAAQYKPPRVAVIDEPVCIGCTRCLKVCPVDAIVGAGKRMHTVVADQCTGCDLCIPSCPVDCISMVDVSDEVTDERRSHQADAARERFQWRQQRLAQWVSEKDNRHQKHKKTDPGSLPSTVASRQREIQQAIERFRKKREEGMAHQHLKQRCAHIFRCLAESNPNPTTELCFRSSFELLVAVMLSAQATDVSVNKATPALFAVADTPEKMLTLGEQSLKRYIRTIGLYNSKAKHIIQTCRLLVDRFESRIPSDRKALESLPGVGRKTANVILNTCFGQPTLAVDTHVFRVSRRLGLAQGHTPERVEQELIGLVPDSYKKEAHHGLVLHGRYVCIAKKPRCEQCALTAFCDYYREQVAVS